jgi:DNA-damage-inducible protein D
MKHPPPEYDRWKNFIETIKRAIISCQTASYNPNDHFRDVAKMITTSKGAERPIEGFMLTRYTQTTSNFIRFLS